MEVREHDLWRGLRKGVFRVRRRFFLESSPFLRILSKRMLKDWFRLLVRWIHELLLRSFLKHRFFQLWTSECIIKSRSKWILHSHTGWFCENVKKMVEWLKMTFNYLKITLNGPEWRKIYFSTKKPSVQPPIHDILKPRPVLIRPITLLHQHHSHEHITSQTATPENGVQSHRYGKFKR